MSKKIDVKKLTKTFHQKLQLIWNNFCKPAYQADCKNQKRDAYYLYMYAVIDIQLLKTSYQKEGLQEKDTEKAEQWLSKIQERMKTLQHLAKTEIRNNNKEITAAVSKGELTSLTWTLQHITTMTDKIMFKCWEKPELKSTDFQSRRKKQAKTFENLIANKQPFDSVKHCLTRLPKRVLLTDIMGYTETKKKLIAILFKFQCVSKLKKNPMAAFMNKPKINTGILIHGPSGTGKTHFVHALATSLESEAVFIPVLPGDILSKYKGDAERNIKFLFEMAAQLKPSIMFFDEGETVFGRRSEESSETSFMITGSLLALMSENPEVIVVVSTNFPWRMDGAFRRRFETKIHVDMPDENTRKLLFKHYLSDYFLCLSEIHYNHLGRISDGYSCSDIMTFGSEVGDFLFNKRIKSEFFRECQYRKHVLVPCEKDDARAIRVYSNDQNDNNCDSDLEFFNAVMTVFKSFKITVDKNSIEHHREYQKDLNYNPTITPPKVNYIPETNVKMNQNDLNNRPLNTIY